MISGLSSVSNALARAASGPLVSQAERSAARRIIELARRRLRAIGGEEAERIAGSLEIAAMPDGTLEVGSSDPSGVALELGELDQRPTPWLQPAFEQSLPEVRQQVRQALIQELKNKTETRR